MGLDAVEDGVEEFGDEQGGGESDRYRDQCELQTLAENKALDGCGLCT